MTYHRGYVSNHTRNKCVFLVPVTFFSFKEWIYVINYTLNCPVVFIVTVAIWDKDAPSDSLPVYLS